MGGLDDAERALEKGDRAAALDALLEAWRARRAGELAEVIDVVSADLARSRPALAEGDRYHDRWIEAEQQGSAADVPRLLPGLLAEPLSTLKLRVERLVARGPDPRVGRGLWAMVEATPTTSSSNFPVWSMTFKALPSMVDASIAPDVKRLSKKKPGGTSNFWPKYTAWLTKLAEQLAPAAELPPTEKKRVDAMLARAKELSRSAPSQAAAPAAKAAAPPVGPAGAVAAARRGAEAKDWEAALQALLIAWRELRSPEIADAIVALSAGVPQEKLVREPAKAAHAAWMALEAKARASDLPALLDALTVGQMTDVEARLARLAARGDDPRIGRRMRAVLDEAPAGNRPVFWQQVFDLSATSAEAVHLDVMSRLGEGDPTVIGRGNLVFGSGPAIRRNAARVRERFIERAGAVKPLPPALAADLRAVVAAVPAAAPDEEASMYAAIAAEPDDDGPRLVLADRLTERGDVRGELIALQCKMARGDAGKAIVSREKAILKKRTEVLGPLADIIWKGSERFERGMLVAMSPRIESARQRELIGHPMLSTVRDVDVCWMADREGAALLLHPTMVSLKRVGSLSPHDFAALGASERPLGIEEIDSRWPGDELSDAERRAIADAPGLPKLRVLKGAWWGGDGMAPPWLLGGELLARLEHLQVGGPSSGQVPAVAAWLRALAALRRRPRLTLEFGDGACVIEDGVVRATRARAGKEWIGALRAAREIAREIVLEGDWSAAERQALR